MTDSPSEIDEKNASEDQQEKLVDLKRWAIFCVAWLSWFSELKQKKNALFVEIAKSFYTNLFFF